ncbi:MAG TPA: DUF2891 domain-containing protein, partial [Bacteroidales bacterium]|nr:DUF2891 domain-containing protein [Bacteroidales bacterium]
MKGHLLVIAAVIVLGSCTSHPGTKEQRSDNDSLNEQPKKLTLQQANKLAELPLACYANEYPNKLGQVLGGKNDLKEPHVLHPVFYGCFDWHSAVHGYWSMVKLVKLFPALDKAAFIEAELKKNITPGNIEAEIAFFNDANNKSYERTYGWAWLLKLSEELHTWDTPLARELEANLKPLTDLIVDRLKSYLPKLRYPIRVGEHNNTAFALCFAWDYATAVNDTSLARIIRQRANDYYAKDQNAPLSWEPNGNDFLSPCLEEVDLMRRVLTEKEFDTWI